MRILTSGELVIRNARRDRLDVLDVVKILRVFGERDYSKRPKPLHPIVVRLDSQQTFLYFFTNRS